MALTETQRRNVAILAAQGDDAEQIAHHVAAPVKDVAAAMPKRKQARKATGDTAPADPENQD